MMDDLEEATNSGRWHGYSMVGNGSSMAINLTALVTQNSRDVYGVVRLLRYENVLPFDRNYL